MPPWRLRWHRHVAVLPAGYEAAAWPRQGPVSAPGHLLSRCSPTCRLALAAPQLARSIARHPASVMPDWLHVDEHRPAAPILLPLPDRTEAPNAVDDPFQACSYSLRADCTHMPAICFLTASRDLAFAAHLPFDDPHILAEWSLSELPCQTAHCRFVDVPAGPMSR